MVRRASILGSLDPEKVMAERTLGGIDDILPYIKDYVRTYMGHSITTTQWKDHLYSFFANREDKVRALDTIDWEVSISSIIRAVHRFILHRHGFTVKGSHYQSSWSTT